MPSQYSAGLDNTMFFAVSSLLSIPDFTSSIRSVMPPVHSSTAEFIPSARAALWFVTSRPARAITTSSRFWRCTISRLTCSIFTRTLRISIAALKERAKSAAIPTVMIKVNTVRS